MSSFEDLSQELIDSIVEHLSKADIHSLRLTSRCLVPKTMVSFKKGAESITVSSSEAGVHRLAKLIENGGPEIVKQVTLVPPTFEALEAKVNALRRIEQYRQDEDAYHWFRTHLISSLNALSKLEIFCISSENSSNATYGFHMVLSVIPKLKRHIELHLILGPSGNIPKIFDERPRSALAGAPTVSELFELDVDHVLSQYLQSIKFWSWENKTNKARKSPGTICYMIDEYTARRTEGIYLPTNGITLVEPSISLIKHGTSYLRSVRLQDIVECRTVWLTILDALGNCDVLERLELSRCWTSAPPNAGWSITDEPPEEGWPTECSWNSHEDVIHNVAVLVKSPGLHPIPYVRMNWYETTLAELWLRRLRQQANA